MTICGLIAIGGLIVIGLAVFFIPLLKGKIK